MVTAVEVKGLCVFLYLPRQPGHVTWKLKHFKSFKEWKGIKSLGMKIFKRYDISIIYHWQAPLLDETNFFTHELWITTKDC